MNCRDIQKFVYVYLDEEFDKRDSLEFEAHVSECDECRAMVRSEEHFRRRLRNQMRAHAAPMSLRDRICAALDDPEVVAEAESAAKRDEGYAEHQSTGSALITLQPRRQRMWMAGALAASLAALYVGTASSPLNGAGFTQSPVSTSSSIHNTFPTPVVVQPDPIQMEAKADVERAVQFHQLDTGLDVQGDRGEVERYLRKKLGLPNVSIPIPESHETRLIGGRLLGPGIALFAYDHRGRRLSVVQRILPASEPELLTMRAEDRVHGYNCLSFGRNESELVFVVTELPASEIRTLAWPAISY